MDPERHGIVHEVVRGCNGVENILDEGLFLLFRDCSEAEMSSRIGVLFLRRGLRVIEPEGATTVSAACPPSDVAGEHGQRRDG